MSTAEAEQLEQEARLLQELAREVAKRHIEPRAEEIDRTHEFPKDVAQAFRDAGLLSFVVPPEYDGSGASVKALAMVAEALGASDASCTMIFTLQCTCTEVIKRLANEEQKKRFFGRIVAGELMALALTEPEAGSDAAGLKMTAEPRGDHYVLNGTKRFITNADQAGMIITFAATAPGRRGKGISTFVVENPSPGLVLSRNEEKMGLHGSTTWEIIYDNVKVPVENRLGPENEGFQAAMRALEKGRVSIGAVAVGLAQSATDQSVEQAKTRRQFGSLIGNFQGLQFMLGDMAIQTAAARELVYRAAELADQGDESFGYVAAMAKCFATDTAMRVTTDAVQMHGGTGYIRGTPVERMMRDAKILQIFEGSNQIMRVLVGRELVGRLD